ncbi:MAG: hypothetical protein JOS17DRAFT_476392 [Linnemannia elongata]|nr:MAG: hypothetical protein JOS17DRAFT_476392 [Linnemannia elongata]
MANFFFCLLIFYPPSSLLESVRLPMETFIRVALLQVCLGKMRTCIVSQPVVSISRMKRRKRRRIRQERWNKRNKKTRGGLCISYQACHRPSFFGCERGINECNWVGGRRTYVNEKRGIDDAITGFTSPTIKRF